MKLHAVFIYNFYKFLVIFCVIFSIFIFIHGFIESIENEIFGGLYSTFFLLISILLLQFKFYRVYFENSQIFVKGFFVKKDLLLQRKLEIQEVKSKFSIDLISKFKLKTIDEKGIVKNYTFLASSNFSLRKFYNYIDEHYKSSLIKNKMFY